MKKLNSKTLQNKLALVSKNIDLANNNIEINSIAEELVTSLLDAEFCSLWYYDEDEMTLVRERGNATPKTISLDTKKGIMYKCFMTKEPKIYNYLASDKDYIAEIDNPDGIKIRSKIIYPLLHKDQLVGVVTAYNSIKKAKKFRQDDLNLLEAISPYLIEILFKLHTCCDKNCVCNQLEPDQAEFLAIKNIQEIEKKQEDTLSSDKMLSSMSNFIHDIRTPANTLQGFLELLESQITDKRLKEYLLNAKESAAFINELTTAMLDRISLQREADASHVKEIDTTKFFANIAEMFVSNMYEKKIDFNVFIDPLLPKTIEVDELKLKRILINLIGNAYKFTPFNKSIEFSVRYNQDTKEATISIKDKGIGIPKEKQKEIFEAFKQAEETTSLEYGGTGLGLSICAQYVEDLGSKLHLDSEVNKGSNFYFSLPLHIKDAEPTFKPLENKNIHIVVLMSPKNSLSILNVARHLIRMNIDKNNITAVSSLQEIPADTTHLIIYQHKFDVNMQTPTVKNMKILLIEEELFSLNAEDLQENCEIVSQYGYMAQELYKFINTKKIPKVLIVDDDKTSVILLEKILENEYCEIDIARNGKVALEMIIDSHKKEQPYSVIYIDNNMPLMSGLEVMRHVREFERDNNLEPVYAVSTSGDMLNLENEGSDFNEYVGKPFRMTEIRKILYR